ncbi:DUF2293 domain-containing protein [Ancylobacter amanitiformis]|uniref:DUF2293 domain-containing protein n=1 Tax=Ancylobacter amanitiformis TaxID=217069 RepID=A0ABU0LPI4_9HYPH|nr:DUF2293 domain-containing protein [Ancylobacter amanitiformis]MDQ0510627.1 hypothetical protein [Ancylobacter amanitiformis]
MTPDDNPATVPTPEQRAAFLEQLRTYLTAMYPRCGYRVRRRLIERARNRGYYGRLGEVAGILANTFIRHECTDYDHLLRINGGGEGLTREEARMVVAQEVADIADMWRRGSAEGDAGYVELRQRFTRRRQKKGRRQRNAGFIATENEAMATYLKGWLERREQERKLAREAQEASLGAPPETAGTP